MAILCVVLFTMLLFDVASSTGNVSQKITSAVVLRVMIHHIPVVGSHIAPTNGREAWETAVKSARAKPNIRSDEAILEGIVWNNRLPKVLGGVLIGMMLAMAGVAFQSLLMNPLADPYTTGVASGSALGSIFLSLAGGGIAAWFGGFALVGAAFASGLLAVSIVYMLARVSGRVSAQTFLLSGTIVGSFFFAMVPLLLSWTNPKDPQQQRFQILSTLYGSLNYIGWPQFWVLMPFCVLGLILFWWDAAELDIMAMGGEESAAHLGVNTEAFKRRIILLGSLMTAAAVSLAGIIAFVGFLVPHVARRLVGSNHRILVPASALLGGIVVILAEYLSRVWLHDLGIGVITSLLGVPFFCALMRQKMKEG